MTRARDQLILSRAKTRQWRGRVREFGASPFLADIEQELVRHHLPTARRKPEDRQLTLF